MASQTADLTSSANHLADVYSRRFGMKPRVFRAPGRVNLIGEHTDYNDGFVMPATIHFSAWVAIGSRPDDKISLHSDAFSDPVEFSLSTPDPVRRNHWSDYVQGVAVALQNAGYKLRGANLIIHGEVPIGSGLSSSAALEVSSGMAMLTHSGYFFGESEKLTELALICRRAENEFVGARVGIMDQFISCHGEPGHAIMLDCRSLQFDLLPFPDDASLVICNTMVKHQLAGGEYNVRRTECEEGVRILGKVLPGIRALRDVTLQQLEVNRLAMPALIYKRCHHVITENDRVQRAAAALKANNLHDFGELMRESHISLRDDYEVSCRELDIMVDIASTQPGVYGSRMTGGGFGGCTVNLVQTGSVGEFSKEVAAGYLEKTHITPEIYISQPVAGVQEVPVSK